MSPFLALGIIAVAVSIAVTLMLLVRRFAAPAGGFFTDSDRAAGVFGVTGTGFAVLLAFVIFLSFSSYDRAREKASVEAVAVSQPFRTAQLFRTATLFSPDARRQLHGELICYARAVIHDEWRTMRDERASSVVDDWQARIDGTVDGMQLHGDKQRLGFDHWFDQSAERQEGRRGRLAEAKPPVPDIGGLGRFLRGGAV